MSTTEPCVVQKAALHTSCLLLGPGTEPVLTTGRLGSSGKISVDENVRIFCRPLVGASEETRWVRNRRGKILLVAVILIYPVGTRWSLPSKRISMGAWSVGLVDLIVKVIKAASREAVV